MLTKTMMLFLYVKLFKSLLHIGFLTRISWYLQRSASYALLGLLPVCAVDTRPSFTAMACQSILCPRDL